MKEASLQMQDCKSAQPLHTGQPGGATTENYTIPNRFQETKDRVKVYFQSGRLLKWMYRRLLTAVLLLAIALVIAGLVAGLAVTVFLNKKLEKRVSDLTAENRELINVKTHQPPLCNSYTWIYYNKTYYLFSDNEGNWSSGQDFCASCGARLALLGNEDQLNFMKSKKGVDDHWIGLKKEPSQPWMWSNGTALVNIPKNLEGVDSGCAYLGDDDIRSASCHLAPRKFICTLCEQKDSENVFSNSDHLFDDNKQIQ